MNDAHRLYHAALEADERYSAELRRAYGANASVARYRWHHDDRAVQAALDAKLAADKAYFSFTGTHGAPAGWKR